MKIFSVCFVLILALGCSRGSEDGSPYVIKENQMEFYEPIGPYYYYEYDDDYYDHHHGEGHHGEGHHGEGHHEGGGHDHGGHGH